jgi:hypothetical protein
VATAALWSSLGAATMLMSLTTTTSTTTAFMPASALRMAWLAPTTFLRCTDLSGALSPDGDGRVVLCLSCFADLQAAVIVADPRLAPADSQCLACGRFIWGRYVHAPITVPDPPPSLVLLRPIDLAALGISVRGEGGTLTPLEVVEVLGRACAAAQQDLVTLTATIAAGDEHLGVRAARRQVLALRAALGLLLILDRQITSPAPDLLLRLRGVVEQLRAGYGVIGIDDGPYAAEARELVELLDPAGEGVRE